MKLILMGDINIQHRTEPEKAFEKLQNDLDSADFRYANMEGCFYKAGDEDIPEKKQWRHSDENQIGAIQAARFDALGGANNVNYGKKAVVNTLNLLKKMNIPITGLAMNAEEAWSPVILEKEGTKIAFIQVTARYYGKESWADADHPGVAGFDPDEPGSLDRIAHYVEDVKKKVDILIFSHHIRLTGFHDIEDYQKKLSRMVIDRGADFVFGHGAHVHQPIEFYKGVPIYHCIGQAVFDWVKNTNKLDGLLLFLTIRDKKIQHVQFKVLYKDSEKNVYITTREDPAEVRQLELIKSLSPTIRIEREGDFFRAIEK